MAQQINNRLFELRLIIFDKIKDLDVAFSDGNHASDLFNCVICGKKIHNHLPKCPIEIIKINMDILKKFTSGDYLDSEWENFIQEVKNGSTDKS